jgi:hypothetical protein
VKTFRNRVECFVVGSGALLLLLGGLGYLFAPDLLFSSVGIEAGAVGRADLRATYASGQIGAALVTLWLFLSAERRTLALPVLSILMCTVTVSRAYAVIVEQVSGGIMIHALWFEAIFAAIACGLWYARRIT